jgi:hypothetical protein
MKKRTVEAATQIEEARSPSSQKGM